MYTVRSSRYSSGTCGPRCARLKAGEALLTTLKPVDRPVALGDKVYQALRRLLAEGAMRPGDALPEVAVAAQLGVSRTPVREALGRLSSEGLVSVEGRGFVVPPLDEVDIDHLYEVRCLLESEALRQIAVRRPGEPALASLKTAIDASVAADRAADAAAFMEANTQFRSAWIALVPNARLVRAIELHADHVRFLRVMTLGDRTTRAIVLRGLRRIAAALALGDGEAAASAMRRHLLEARKALLRAANRHDRQHVG
jgi:DNA-binding GntR family transcriptional regulator